MRHLILTAIAITMTGQAAASSIEFVTTPTVSGGSVLTLGCEACPPLKVDERRRGYEVPVLAEGTQQVDFIDVDGQARLVRTEAWMGGSPVVFMSKADGWTTGAGDLVAAAVDNAIDLTATTAAVESGAADETAIATMSGAAVSPVATLDTEHFQLRLR